MRGRLSANPKDVEAGVIMAISRPESENGTLKTGKGGGMVKVYVGAKIRSDAYWQTVPSFKAHRRTESKPASLTKRSHPEFNRRQLGRLTPLRFD
jgi:hypothetical protein